MKRIGLYLFMVILLSSFTSVFGIMPNSWNDFLLGFGICFLFWSGMLAPILSD